MMRGMYAAISGLDVNQTMLDATANDLANVNTVGYKSSEVTFADALTQVQRDAAGAVGATGGSNPLQVGLGVELNAVSPEITQGSLQSTGNPTDVAIQGEGWFRVGTGTPSAAYSLSLLRSVRMEMPSTLAAWVRLPRQCLRVSRIRSRSTSATVRPTSARETCSAASAACATLGALRC